MTFDGQYLCLNCSAVLLGPPLAFVVLNGAIGWLRRYPARRRADRLRRGLCPECGYDLRASRGRCPECGHPTADDRPPH